MATSDNREQSDIVHDDVIVRIHTREGASLLQTLLSLPLTSHVLHSSSCL